ncbi:MAG: hypothetical protein H8E44_38745 [Planctomycetes bacterium]|nr:hypothetical protein [Planctomycetota bacterium]MBL7044071.1 hypothetical protein [Pirellulaceae bacterium]
MLKIYQMAVLSLAAILALTALPGCTPSQPDSVPEIDQSQTTETFGNAEKPQEDEPDTTTEQTPGTDSDSVALSESRFGRGVKLMAAGEPIDVEVGHLVPCVSDWNSDGKKDLLVGQFKSGAIRLYLNQGTDTEPVFQDFSMLNAGGKPIRLDAG